MNENITNKQLRDSLLNINLLLGNISVSGEDVFTLSDCRKALRQLTTMISIEEASNDK